MGIGVVDFHENGGGFVPSVGAQSYGLGNIEFFTKKKR